METFSQRTVCVRTALVCAIIVGFIAASASRPPAKPVTSFSQIAGKWQGVGGGQGGNTAVTQTINADGTYTAILSSGPAAGTYTGRIALVDGKLRGRSDQT